ncbi:MAG: hypothetical protein C0608_02015 [Deltaproteobacteria bacterium]|nr:MAG: hypothetical protein C0608_02015 [Deltaproteobacteria bacterium]
MVITQLSISLDDTPGKTCALSELLGDEGINIRALSAVMHGDDNMVHIVADQPKKAQDLLVANGYEVLTSQVIAVETPDHPGGVTAVMRPLARAGIRIRFFYPMIGRILDNAVMILGVDNLEAAIDALKKEYINILEARPGLGIEQ